MIIPEWQLNILSAFSAIASSSTLSGDRERFLEISKATYSALLEIDNIKNLNDQEIDTNGLPLKIKSPQHLVLANSKDLYSYLALVFALKPDIFEISDDPAHLETVDAIRTKLRKDGLKYGWSAELVKAIWNAVLYNRAPVEVRLVNGDNRIKALCPFNTFYDSSVQIDKLGSEGMFAGYHEAMSIPLFYTMLFSIPEQYRTEVCKSLLLNISTLDSILRFSKNVVGSTMYSDMFKSMETSGVKDAPSSYREKFVDWSAVFKNLDSQNGGDIIPEVSKKNRDTISSGSVSVTTYYRRALPEWLNLPKDVYPSQSVDSLKSIPIYKITILNGSYVLSIVPVSETHGMLPIVMGALDLNTSTNSSPSFATQLIPIQNFDTKLSNARIGAIRKALLERVISDERYLDAGGLSELLSTGRATVKTNAGNADDQFDIRKAVYTVPHDLSSIGALLGTINDTYSAAVRMSGNTPQLQGSRVPGNKLAIEASQEAQFSEGRFRIHALMFQQTFMNPVKIMLKSNLAETASILSYLDKITGQKVVLTPDMLSEDILQFMLSDGLLDYGQNVSPDVLTAMLNVVAQTPLLQQLYDMRAMFSLLAKSAGLSDVDRIPSASLAQQQLIASAQASAKGQGMQQTQPQPQSQAQEDPAAGTAPATAPQ